MEIVKESENECTLMELEHKISRPKIPSKSLRKGRDIQKDYSQSTIVDLQHDDAKNDCVVRRDYAYFGLL